jgi:hypothetical protein
MRNLPGFAAEYRVWVEVSTARGSTVIYDDRRGASIGLVEASWSADGKVGLLVCNAFSGPVLISYDLTSNRPLDRSTFRSALEQQLETKYSLPRNMNVIQWACSREGKAAYERGK